MAIWKTPIDIQTLNTRNANTLASHCEIIFTDVGDDYLCATMPIDERTKQPIGIMHGGASCILAETIGSTAANFCVDLKKQYCVGLDINTNHIRSVRSGLVTGTTKPFHIGRSTQVWSIEIINENNQLVSINRLTMAVLDRNP
jgi:1,4-dihydroxy-2-naphthoyl-CoA hydrolase